MGSLHEILRDRRSRWIILIVACLVVFAVFLIFRYTSAGMQNDALNAVPQDAAMILEVKQAKDFYQELTVTSGVWSELVNFPLFAGVSEKLRFLDSLFANSENAPGLLSDHTIYVSFHLADTAGAGLLFLTALPANCSSSDARAFVLKAAGTNAREKEMECNNENIFEITANEEAVKFYYAVSKGIFVCSLQPGLVAGALKQQRSGNTVSKNGGFVKVQATAGKKVQASLYVNFNYFPAFFALTAGKEYAARISELSGFAGWTTLDASLKKDALLLNGFAEADTGTSFIGTFSGQSPQASEITGVIPSSTAAFLSYSFSDFDTWYKNYKSYLQKKGILAVRAARLAKMNKEFSADIEKEITTWIGKEMALVMTEPADTGFSDNIFLVIKSDHVENVPKLLSAHSESLEKKAEQPKKTSKTKKIKNKKSKNKNTEQKEETKSSEKTEIKDNTIYEYKIPGVFPALFGKIFDGVDGNYYAIEGNYVIFGNSLNGLRNFLKEYSEEKNLDNNNNYLAFSKNVSVESNLYLYCNIKKSLGIFMKYANPTLSGYIGNNLSLFRNFDAFAFQTKTNGDMFYCNFCLKTNTVVISESDALWSVNLDSTVYCKPVIIQDTAGKSKSVIVFDNACNMYKISTGGSIEWKLKLEEKPLGDIHVIDADKNGKSQYLFNTSSCLYIVDADGKIHKNFPVRFTAASTAPLTLADYSKSKDYRIIVPCGKKILNYMKDGAATAGWNVVKTSADVVSEVSCMKYNGGDCYAVADKSGTIYIFDRKGKNYITLKEQPLVAYYAKFYVAKAAGKKGAVIITSDMKGNIIFISADGKIEKTSVPGLSAQHFFLYEDQDGDKNPEYVFVDKTKLSVYDNADKCTGTCIFPADITVYPEFFEKNASENYLDVFCSKLKKIYVIGKDCSVKDGYPLNATTMFSIGSLNSDATYNLIAGDGSTVYNYSFE